MNDYDEDDLYAVWSEEESFEDDIDGYNEPFKVKDSPNAPGFEDDYDEFSGEFFDEPDPDEMHTLEDTEFLVEGTVLLDADGYAFQKRRDEWFMAGAQYGATEFSGKFPARRLL